MVTREPLVWVMFQRFLHAAKTAYYLLHQCTTKNKIHLIPMHPSDHAHSERGLWLLLLPCHQLLWWRQRNHTAHSTRYNCNNLLKNKDAETEAFNQFYLSNTLLFNFLALQSPRTPQRWRSEKWRTGLSPCVGPWVLMATVQSQALILRARINQVQEKCMYTYN